MKFISDDSNQRSANMIKLLFGMIASIVIATGAVLSYMQDLVTKQDIKNFAQREELHTVKNEILLLMTQLKIVEYDDKISSGKELTTIEKIRLDRLQSDVDKYEVRIENINN